MTTIKDSVPTLALAILLLNLIGCGGVSDRPELGQVTGTVTLDGQPLKGIAVVFHPDSGRPARGKTDPEGKYELTYIGTTSGTKVGHNRVEIAPNEEGEEEDSEEAGDSEIQNAGRKPPKSGNVRIPARYNTQSVLEADVKPGENVFDFQLESKPSA